ncbi:hypothetical protein D1159_01355 [Pseudoflavonifractor sp. 524-17]|nr:hypothetical protein [Pseudoflavonifractor sp. 524-17]
MFDFFHEPVRRHPQHRSQRSPPIRITSLLREVANRHYATAPCHLSSNFAAPLGGGFSYAFGAFSAARPLLPGCITEGKDLANAIFMAGDAVSMWLWYAEEQRKDIPAPAQPPAVTAPEFANYVYADTEEYRRKNSSRAERTPGRSVMAGASPFQGRRLCAISPALS